ncbi:site-2 protease family protein [Shumkonia mesophila]|uniref:site-2 protease family protein n=1 Tax=Shumkonia mesophila TaxID=2838854 RepID=UPI002934F7AD|nr:site-2 protease family protein [Shumkonia mesophila]
MIYLLGFVLTALAVVGIHEAGHLVAARLCGIPVKKFALGLGPEIIGRQIGGTRYQMRALPVGGLVDVDNEALYAAAWWKRAAVFLAGPAVNIVAGFAAIAGLAIAYGHHLPAALRMSGSVLGTIATSFFSSISQAVAGTGITDLGGPVMLAKVAGDAVSLGAGNAILMIALVSFVVGLFNLLPLPLLDGGQALIAIGERVAGRRLPESVANWLTRAGIAMLILLMLAVTYGDLVRLLA